MTTPKDLNTIDKAKNRLDKALVDLFYKGYNAGKDEVLQYQFEREIQSEARYIDRCLKGSKEEVAQALNHLLIQAKQDAVKLYYHNMQDRHYDMPIGTANEYATKILMETLEELKNE